jgi:hypothetical protein
VYKPRNEFTSQLGISNFIEGEGTLLYFLGRRGYKNRSSALTESNLFSISDDGRDWIESGGEARGFTTDK